MNDQSSHIFFKSFHNPRRMTSLAHIRGTVVMSSFIESNDT